MGRVGHVSDPYNEGDDEGELAITGLPDDLEGPPEDAVASGPDEADDDDTVDVDVDDEDNDTDDTDDEDDEGLDDELEDEVAYTLDDFDDDQFDALFDGLDEAAIPYLWDGDELFVQAADEQAVDELVERVANPHEIAAEGDGDGGGWLLGELFVTADRLQRDPEEHETVASLLQLANASDEASAPYGLAEPEWEQLRQRVNALATILEQDKPDPDQAIDAARELRTAVRPYV